MNSSRRLTSLVSVAALLLLMPTAAAQQTKGNDASIAAASQPASSPARSPREEAELAIQLADDARAADATALAMSAYQRDPTLDVALLAMGAALDASGKGMQAITYLKQYLSTPAGRDRDWRGHSRLANIYIRAKSFQLALRELELAQKAPLFPASDPIVRAYWLIDKTEASINTDGRQQDAAVAVNEIAALVRARGSVGEAIRKQPRLVLACARAAYSVEAYRRNSTDDAFEWALKIALPEAMSRVATAAPDERAPWLVVWECYNLARQMRTLEVDTLAKSEQAEASLPGDFRKLLTDEQKKARMFRSQRRIMLPRDLAALEEPMAKVVARLQMLNSLDAAKAAVAEYPETREFKYMLADSQMLLGDSAGATATLRKILEQEPGDRHAQEALNQIAASQPTSAPSAVMRSSTD